MLQKYNNETQPTPISVQQMCKFVHIDIFSRKGIYLYIIYTIRTFTIYKTPYLCK